MLLNQFNYIKIPPKEDMESTVKALLCENGKAKVYDHVCAVAQQNVKIAKQFALIEEKCYLAGLLHDISVVIKHEDMLSYVRENSWHLCEAEEKFSFLLHQQLSAVVAEDFFGINDSEILSPIACHTTLKANPSCYEMALFIADKLSWDQDGTPPFYDEVKAALQSSLEKASYAYMKFMTKNGRVLFPHEDWTKAMKWLEERK